MCLLSPRSKSNFGIEQVSSLRAAHLLVTSLSFLSPAVLVYFLFQCNCSLLQILSFGFGLEFTCFYIRVYILLLWQDEHHWLWFCQTFCQSTTNISTIGVPSLHSIFQFTQDIPNHRDNKPMTFNYMVYIISTPKGYFSVLLGAMPRESHLTELYNLSQNDSNLHVLKYVFL